MKKITFKVLSICFISLLTLSASGQTLKKAGNAQQFGKTITQTEGRTPSGHIRCASTEYEAYLRTQDRKRLSIEEFENWLAPKIAEIKADRISGRSPQAIYNIPVVIHIIHNGDCIGTGENITDAQAVSQIKVMNEDFRRMTGTRGGANSTGLAVDSEINFILAKRDPSGNPTNGINRVTTSIASYNEADTEAVKASTIWDPTKYLNMWTLRFGGDLDGVLGYAQFPTGSTLSGIPAGTTTANTDGVVASYDAFGTNDDNDGTFILNATYNLGRTMTHEVGHWLGLRHIWGDNATCTVNGTDSGQDYCPDTPAASTENYGCPNGANSCPAGSNDMIQNYMDYTDDSCMDTFTANQKARMVAVMINSPRRSTLNASNGATAPSAGIYFKPNANTCSYTESTTCNYTDINYPLSIIKAPTQNTVITFTTGGTATNNVDYQIMTPSVTFVSGTTTDQILTIRYFNDGFVEGNETLTIGMSINTNGGDGSIISNKSILDLSITDDDIVSTSTYSVPFFSENFDGTVSMNSRDLDGDGNNWGIGATANTIGFDTNFAFSRSWDSGGFPTDLTPDNILYTASSITMPSTNSNLSFYAGTTQGGIYYEERYSAYLTTINPASITIGQLDGLTPVIDDSVLAGPAQRNLISVPIPSTYNGQTVYLVLRHHNTYDQNWIMIDDILISTSVPTLVQTEVNTMTAYQATVNSAGTFYAKDNTTGNVIVDGTADAFNYGCTNVSVNRSTTTAGAAAVNYGANTANNLKVMAKTVTVTPTTNNASGNATFKFYFTESEIAAWETATGNSRTALKVFKGGENIAYATTIGAFGTNVTLTATSASGLSGVYYFGIDAALSTDSFDALSAISVYPNPASDVLNVTIPSELGSNVTYQVFNYLGQVVKANKTSSSNFSINTSSFSNGVYFIKLNVEGATKTLRFIKN